MVLERLANAADRHLQDIDDVIEWFHSTASNWPSAIANQKRGGGKLDRDEVQRVILDFGWDSYWYVAQCLQVFAVAFRHSLGETMTAEERIIFEQFIVQQPYLGGLAHLYFTREKRLSSGPW